MSAVVLDASALLVAMTRTDADAAALRRRLAAADCHAPHLIDAEVGNVLRRMTLRAQLPPGLAEVLLSTGPRLVGHRYEQRGALAAGAWALRDNVSFYDGLYVALAAAMGVVLLSADARLAGAPNLPCTVELVG